MTGDMKYRLGMALFWIGAFAAVPGVSSAYPINPFSIYGLGLCAAGCFFLGRAAAEVTYRPPGKNPPGHSGRTVYRE